MEYIEDDFTDALIDAVCGKLPSTWYTLIGENFDPTEVYNYVAPLCLWLCTLCRSHFHSGQMWHPADGFHRGHCRPHHCGAGIRLAHGVGGGGTVPAFYHCPQNLALFGSVWLCHRGILALLFQGFAAGQHQPSGPS